MIETTIELMFETMSKPPTVCAHIEGSSEIHNLVGDVYLYPFLEGSLLAVDVEGIPFSGFYGFHIHQHGPCIMGEGYTGFHDVGGHFSLNPDAPHPYHSGDLPVLMSFYGHAFMVVYTDRFTPDQVLGRAMIIHEWPDDYRTQPTGNAGQHIGCGTFFPCCFEPKEYMSGMTGFQLGGRVGMPRGTVPPTETPAVPPAGAPTVPPTGPTVMIPGITQPGTPSGTVPDTTMPSSGPDEALPESVPQETVPLAPQPIGPPGAPLVTPSLSGPTAGLPSPIPGRIPGIMPPNSSTGTIPGIMPPNSSTGTGVSAEGLSGTYQPGQGGAQEHTQTRIYNRFCESYQPIY